MTQANEESIIDVPQKGDENPLYAFKHTQEWAFVWSRAIARAWNEPEGDFAHALLSGDPNTVRQLFLRELGYDLPRGLKLTVKRGTGVYQSNVHGTNGWAAQAADLGASVCMVLPRAPLNPSDQALALTDYQASGQNYPFTF